LLERDEVLIFFLKPSSESPGQPKLELSSFKIGIAPKERCTNATKRASYRCFARSWRDLFERIGKAHRILVYVDQAALLEVVFEDVLNSENHFFFFAFMEPCRRPFL
jgi:hypothetical protein